jgi:NAD(P)-dependent dehydrogenase (short-subunit alcohol dehydrogenase family)
VHLSPLAARYPDLAGVPVLVTGGASGIGAAITEHFVAQGAAVAMLDVREEAIAALDAGLRQRHDRGAAARAVDLRDVDAMRAAIAALAGELGAFRVLVNNAGDDERHAAADVTPSYWDDRFAVNIRHQFFAAQAVAPGMAAAGGGSIVNLGSISWMFGAPGLIAYTTAKAAVAGLTKSLAREWGAQGIRVNCIAPGMIWTRKQTERAALTDPGKRESYLQRQCIKEPLDAGDVARLVVWLASGESRRCSGQTFIVDGGVV